MKSLKFIVRLALFVLALFAVAASTDAQQCPGYNPTMYQGDPGGTSGYNPPSPCAGKSLNSTASFYQTNSTTDYCGSLQTGGQLVTPSTVAGNGVASCTPVVVYCYPTFELEVTAATNQQDYNRFYNRAYDYTYTSSGCARILFPSPSRQDFWQCAWYSCPPPPAPPPPPGVDCSCCTPLVTSVPPLNRNRAVRLASAPQPLTPPKPQACCDPSCPTPGSPIIVDLTGDGFFLTDAAHGVLFDISGMGRLIQMGWTAGATNAFLALPGADGLVRNGRQLFGNFTPQPKSTTPNGFAALAVYDLPANGGNGDGVIDARDAIFSSLRLWIDANHDGIAQPEELHTLPSLGVNSISLAYKWDQRTDQYGNVLRYHAQVNPGDPTNTGRMAYDVFFVTNQPTSTNTACAVPAPIKGGMLSTNQK